MIEDEKTASLRDVLYIVFKWKKFIISTISIIILTAALFTFFSPPVYEATAKVLLKRERPDIILTTEKSNGIHRPITSKDVLAEIEIIKNRALLEKVITSCELDQECEDENNNIMAYILLPFKGLKHFYHYIHSKRELTSLEECILKFSKHLNVRDIRHSDIIEISYESSDPEAAKKVVNSITEQYIDHRLSLYGTSQAYHFFQKQLYALEENLKQSTKALKDFQQRQNTILSEEEKERLFAQLSDAEASLRMTEVDEKELNQKIDYLNNKIRKLRKEKITDSVEITSRILDDLKEQLVSLELQRSDLLQKYTKEHPQIKSVENEITSLKELINKEENKFVSLEMTGENATKDFLKKELASTQSQLASAKIRKKSLTEQVDSYRKKIRYVQNQSYKLKELEREAKADEEAYNIYLDKLKESEILMELDKMKVINATVLQYAETPIQPIKPKKARNMFLAVILGFMMSFGSVIVLEYFSHGLKNQDEVERFLKLKTLASIPYKNNE